jgi:hypothetical protein
MPFGKQYVPESVHFCPAQHGPPRTPQSWQVPGVPEKVLVQAVPGSVQTRSTDDWPGQQGSPLRPQPHRLPLHIPYVPELNGIEQVSPSAKHCPLRQHPLPLQLLPGQQGSPGSPHCWQIPDDNDEVEQTNPLTHDGADVVIPSAGQHDSPGPPQLEQRLPRQERPEP